MQTHIAEVVILVWEDRAWSYWTSNLSILGRLVSEVRTTGNSWHFGELGRMVSVGEFRKIHHPRNVEV
jgi:hypothetical protein